MIDPTDYFPAENSKRKGDKGALLLSDFVFTWILIVRISSHLRDSRCALTIDLWYPNLPFPGQKKVCGSERYAKLGRDKEKVETRIASV
jgi:hypothetical protein